MSGPESYPQPEGGCVSYGNVTVCRPRYYAFHTVRLCPICEKRRRIVNLWEMWYGVTSYCLTCGERWEDGERSERPFRPGWRKENVAYARSVSQHALTRDAFRKAVEAYEADYFAEMSA